MNRTVLTFLLAFVWTAGQAQVKCHIEGQLKDKTQGTTVIVCPASADLRASDNFVKATADADGHFALDVEADKMCLYTAFLEEQYQHGSWRYGNFLVENKATVKLLFDDNTWKVIAGGREQMLKVKMDAEAEKLYLGRMEEISNQAKKEILPIVEELQKQGKNPEEDSLLMARNKVYEDEYKKLYDAYRVWESEYYKAHPMLYALYDLANDMRYCTRDVEGHDYGKQMRRCLDTYHTTYENFLPKDPVHNLIRMHEAAWNLKPGKPYIDYQVRNTDGNLVPISSLIKGKVTLIDLWASWCGPCRQHSKDMIPLYEKYKDKGLVILDFPCNQFGGQAPGDIASIHEFCTSKYETTFPQFDKIDVNGENESPLFAFLKSKQAFKGFGNGEQAKFMDEMLKKQDPDYASKPDIKWNFTKFLVDSKGNVVARFEPTVSMNLVSTMVSSKLY